MTGIGFLSVAHMHAGSYAKCVSSIPEARLIGVHDPDQERGKAFASAHKTKFFEKADDLLARPDLHGVILTSENAFHARWVVLAAKAKKHILCEKPLATTLKDAALMVRAAKENGVELMTAFPCRYLPAVQKMQTILKSGFIGEILAVRASNHGQMPGGWFIDKKLSGGGALTDHIVHVADLMRWLLESEVREVYAEMDTRFHPIHVEDCGLVSLEFRNGVFATIDPSWSRPNSFPTWGDVTLQFVGSRGILSLDGFAEKVEVFSRLDKARPMDKHYRYEGWGEDMDLGMVKDFISTVCTKNLPAPITGQDGAQAVKIVDAAYRSVRLKKPVNISL